LFNLKCIKPVASINGKPPLESPFPPLIALPAAVPPKLALRFAHCPSLEKGLAFPARSEPIFGPLGA
jgi:hypothetical protein